MTIPDYGLQLKPVLHL